ncbi:FecR family protein [Hymenobacter canadensis]|uniref:FecR domain-containing protein n=1 Tax=Hymenobacter canadensis TaxID=2999067 RepID=A0ABY7LN84_9BACT|nr:FecR domain-containing protein [Hymenobacter canadensis]WBA40912.1 FecR domain-containing protein [Hymenobacter canadensis]
MNQADLQTLLRRYQAGQCTPEEQQQVETWYDTLRQDPPLLMTTDEREALRTELWHRITAGTIAPAAAPAPAPGGFRAWPAASHWAAAATLAAGLGLGAWYVAGRPTPADVATAPAATTRPAPAGAWRTLRNSGRQHLPLTLPDSSTVVLAPASSLRYPTQFGGGQRQVRLVGEAFFHVRPDAAHPFQVYTEQLVTTVLGTSFRVRAYAGQPQELVKVSTGRVSVTPRRMLALASKGSVTVVPNQQAVYAAGQQPLHRELVPEPVVLQPQFFVFDDQPVADVLAALGTAYGVDIRYDAAALAGCTVTLNLQRQSLYGKLDVLCQVLGASYSQQDARIEFRSPGCQNP